jgi:hypothetical protein
MAIKIIKQGVKEFSITCPYCGCEFTYEKEDVHNSQVICPCCSTNLLVGTVNTNPFPMPIWYNQQVAPDGYKIRDGLNKRPLTLPDGATLINNENSCEGCPNNPKYLKTPYVGDWPCQWCQKNPYKVTCTSSNAE